MYLLELGFRCEVPLSKKAFLYLDLSLVHIFSLKISKKEMTSGKKDLRILRSLTKYHHNLASRVPIST